jgi:hypothetical protein
VLMGPYVWDEVGPSDAGMVGRNVGLAVGASEIWKVGPELGTAVGDLVGGATVGRLVGEVVSL